MKKLQYTVEQIAFLHPANLENEQLNEKKYHYYFIVSAPIKYINDIHLVDNEIVFMLSDGKEDYEVTFPNDKDKYTITAFTWKYKQENDKVTALLSYTINHKNGCEERFKDLEFAANDLYYLCEKKLKFKIEYIGQSYAQNGSRTAQNRLSSHSTLQKILVDSSLERNKDIRLFLLGVDIACIDNKSLTGNESRIFYLRDVDGTISSEYVNLFEAFLINTFKPKYNKNFVSGEVPSECHESYKKVIEEAYDDFSVVFAIQDCKRDYIFFTESKSLEIVGGVIVTSHSNGVIDTDAMKVSFNEANKVYDKDYEYSFEAVTSK